MPRCELRLLIPVLLAAAAVTDGLFRVLPSDPYVPSGFQGVNRWSQRDGRMEPNRRFASDRTYGELALLGNRPAFLQARGEVFTTDQHGYRNLPAATRQGADVLLCGSSFSLGLSLSDDETLAAQLARQTGARVYNASLPHGSLSLARIRQVAGLLGMRQGVVLVEYLNRDPLPRGQLERPLEQSWLPGLDQGWTLVKGVSKNPLRSLLRARFRQRAEDGTLLPNTGSGFVQEFRLRNGEPMLFYAGDVEFHERPSPVTPTVEALAWLQRQLRRDGLELQVLLVPSSYTVYRPLLGNVAGEDTGAGYLPRLESALRERGILVHNAQPRLRAEAALRLARGQYLYWRDDAHWNPRGVAVVAGDVASWWRATGHPAGADLAQRTTAGGADALQQH